MKVALPPKSDLLFVLAPDVSYRRESFGGLVFRESTRETLAFNHAGAFAIEKFEHPTTLQSVENELELLTGTGNHISFMKSLERTGIIRISISSGISRARLFFTDVTDFPVDRMYAPLGAEVELTLRCMRRCTYCAYNSSPDISSIGQLAPSQYLSIFKSLREAGIFYIRFTGGDPLTRGDSLDIVSDADKLGFGVAFASDLTILQEEHASRLASLKNLMFLQTTLDGPTPEIADALRGNGNYRQVIKGIQRLQRYGIPLVVGTVLTKLNFEHVYATAALVSTWKIPYCVSPLYAAGRAANIKDLILNDEQLAFAYKEFGRAVSDGLVRPADPAWSLLSPDIARNSTSNPWAGRAWLIRSPDRLVRIDPYGRCYTSIHLKEFIGEEAYIGRLPQDPISPMWQTAPLLSRLRAERQKNSYYGDVVDVRSLTTS